jgi:hypothetical protein
MFMYGSVKHIVPNKLASEHKFHPYPTLEQLSPPTQTKICGFGNSDSFSRSTRPIKQACQCIAETLLVW